MVQVNKIEKRVKFNKVNGIVNYSTLTIREKMGFFTYFFFNFKWGILLLIMPVQYRFWRQRTNRLSMSGLSTKPALLAYYIIEFLVFLHSFHQLDDTSLHEERKPVCLVVIWWVLALAIQLLKFFFRTFFM
jgi:hypothetical protein